MFVEQGYEPQPKKVCESLDQVPLDCSRLGMGKSFFDDPIKVQVGNYFLYYKTTIPFIKHTLKQFEES